MRSNRTQLFEAYDEAGGEFHGPEDDAHIPKRARRRRRPIVVNDDDETDSMDDAFDI